MHRGVLTCRRDASLADVAELMAMRRVHSVVVTDDARDPDALWGIVSDLDLAAASSVRDLDEQSAGAAAATAPLTVGPWETLPRAAQLIVSGSATALASLPPALRQIATRLRPDHIVDRIDRFSRQSRVDYVY